MPKPSDPCGRRIDYLRLSVTDQCQLRCRYCRPTSEAQPSRRRDLLTDDELATAAAAAVRFGITKIRITGGEPLLRPGLPGLVARLAAIPGLRDLSLTTNGILLADRAGELHRAGLRRVNVSLDSLLPERFHDITGARGADPRAVLDGVGRALEAGLSPVKLNMVVMSGINDSEIPDFVRLTQELPVHVRFIELMPIGETGRFSGRHQVPLAAVRKLCGPLDAVPLDDAPLGFGPAEYSRRPGAKGTVGFIAALSRGFCGRCNRLRLTAQGRLMPCLGDESGVDLGPILRGKEQDSVCRLNKAFDRAVAMKPVRHRMAEAGASRQAAMCSLGG